MNPDLRLSLPHIHKCESDCIYVHKSLVYRVISNIFIYSCSSMFSMLNTGGHSAF